MPAPESEINEYDPALAEVAREGHADDEVSVIARVSDVAGLPPGVRVITSFGDIVTLRARRSQIGELARSPVVVAMEASQQLLPSLEEVEEVSETDPAFDEHDEHNDDEDRDDLSGDKYTRRPEGTTATGRGVVVAVLDWGCDFAHPAFRKADGSTRLAALWDQRGSDDDGPGNRWGYGQILTAEKIDRALHEENPYRALGYDPSDSDPIHASTGRTSGAHGTHVLDIAAGTGSGGGMPGVAPEADLVFVHLAMTADVLGKGNLGDSATVLEALDFAFTTAGERPCVVNMSLGAHGGPHDGSTLVEQGIDRAVWLKKGRAVVNSAGNYFGDRAHAQGRLAAGAEAELRMSVPAEDPTPSELELWYGGRDRFTVTVIGPDGTKLAAVAPSADAAMTVDGKEVGHVYHVRQVTNGDHQVDLFLDPLAPGGIWTIKLHGDVVEDGRYYAWIELERGPHPQFSAATAVGRSTTGTLCNGRLSITVGAYDPHGDHRGIGAFSSAGPTRDGRVKPEIVAPGERIRAARSTPPGESPQARYTVKGGTSMAAPHVTGTVALMFEAAGRPVDISDIRALLFLSTDCAGPTGAVDIAADLHRFGHGYLDIPLAERTAREWGEAQGVPKRAVPDPREAALEEAAGDEVAPALGADASAIEVVPMCTHCSPSNSSGDSVWHAATTFHDVERSDQEGALKEATEDEVAAAVGDEATDIEVAPKCTQCSSSNSSGNSLWQAAMTFHNVERSDRLHEIAFASRGVGPQDELVPVARPLSMLGESVQPGDLLVRSAPCEGVLHSGIVISGRAESSGALRTRGVQVELAGPGTYVEVVEVPVGGGPARFVGRRLTDAWGRVPRGQAILRPTPSSASTEEEPAWSAAEQAVNQMDWCRMRQTIVANARTEEARWTRPDGTKLLENDADQLLFLTAYWMAVPGFANAVDAGRAARRSAADDDDFPWSAAFICFVMHASGMRQVHGFNFGSAHMAYIVGALRNRERGAQDRPFWLVDAVELQHEAIPQPGDLLCLNRLDRNGRWTQHSYATLRNQFWGANGANQNVAPAGSSHCTLVVGTAQQGGRRVLETIGGNEGAPVETVLLRRDIQVDQNGNIPNPQAQHIFGMIKLTRC